MNENRKREYLISIIKAFLNTSISIMKYYKASATTKKAKEVCQKSIDNGELALKQLPKYKHIEILEYLYSCFVGNNAIAYSISGKIVTNEKLIEYDSDEHFEEFLQELETQRKEQEEKEKARQETMEAIKKAKEQGKKVEMVCDKKTKTTKPMIIEEKDNA